MSTAVLSTTYVHPFWIVSQGSVVVDYIVEWKRDTSMDCLNEDQGNYTTPNNTYTITGLEENSRYIITVRARNSAGTGDASDPITKVTKEAGERELM